MKIKVLRTLPTVYRRPGVFRDEVYTVKRMIGDSAVIEIGKREVALDPEEFEEVTDD